MNSTIHISQSCIIEDGNGIILKMPTEEIDNIKEIYGIDLSNKALLAYLKKHGGLSITTSVFRDIMDSCPTEDQLDKEDDEELLAAKAGMAIAEAKLGEKSKYASIPTMQ